MYDSEAEELLVVLSDSSAHVIYRATVSPSLVPADDSISRPSSEVSGLMRAIGDIAERAELGRTLNDEDSLVCSGFTPFDDLGAGAWLQERVFVPLHVS